MLVVQFHTDGGPFIFTAYDQDRANRIVILMGAGGEFIPSIDFASFGNVADPNVWSQVHDEGVQIVENIANTRVPVIAAIEGRAPARFHPITAGLLAGKLWDRNSPDTVTLTAFILGARVSLGFGRRRPSKSSRAKKR